MLPVVRFLRTSTLKRLSAKLEELAVELHRVSRNIDEFQEYSYQYNVKIVSVPQTSQDESSAITSALCERLFKAMGSKTSTQSIESRQETPAMAVRGQSYLDSLGGCQKIML